MRQLQIFDTTLRDGAQREGISFSVEDKIKIAKKLDEFGVNYIEGGWPGSNPKDLEFFRRISRVTLDNAKIAAFGSTRRSSINVKDDPNIQAILTADTPVVTIVGKCWDFHVLKAIETSLQENLNMISDTISYLKEKGKEVIFDAEHFFDGFKRNPEYALDCLKAAVGGGVDTIVLCDTNGGALPLEIQEIVRKVKREIITPLGIHAHDDAGMAVANTIIAVHEGAVHVQGTINGYGERCGNGNLCTIIPILQLKMGIKCIDENSLKNLTKLSHFVAEIANIVPSDRQPFVGNNAFAHKGGIHVDAVIKHPETYEHVAPEKVGNRRRVLISELAGKSNVLYKARENNIKLAKSYPETKAVLEKLKRMEYEGYQFEGAEGSFELLLWKTMNSYKPLFDLEGFRVIVEKHKESDLHSEATIKVRVGKQQVHTAAEGNGPVNALDNALRKALEEIYPNLKDIKLVDYKVRVLDGKEGTGSKVRVLIESRDDKKSWGTVGVSPNIIEASWIALVDSIEFGLLCKRNQEINELKKSIKQLDRSFENKRSEEQ